jgi:hypothetical protein
VVAEVLQAPQRVRVLPKIKALRKRINKEGD